MEPTIHLVFSALLARFQIGAALDDAWLAHPAECLFAGITMEPSR